MATYIAFLHKDSDSDFGVSFPDFPGCVTAGTTLDEARQLAGEALGLHIEGMNEDGETVPAPSSLDEVMELPEAVDAVVMVVNVEGKAPKVVRVNVTFTEGVLEEIDRFVKRQGTSRSAFLASAAAEKIRKAATG
jgi:predicted RNase H-like HicB family nuclease